MSWFALDDKLHSSAEAARAGVSGVGAYALAGSWCADHLTDGKIPREVAHRLAPPSVWEKTKTAGLVTTTDDGYQLVGYLRGNPSRGEVEERVAAKSEAKQKAGKAGGIRSGQVRRGEAPTKQTGSTDEANWKQTGSETKPPPLPSPSSAPTERATAEPSPPPAGPEPRPARPASPGQATLALSMGDPELAPTSSTRPRGDGGPKIAEPEKPLGTAWRTWRIAYKAKYNRAYPGSGPAGKAMASIAKAAVDYLADLGRPPEDLEALLKHWWRKYIADPGQASKVPGGKGFLEDKSHAIQFFEQNVAAYGSPWDREMLPSIRASPEPQFTPVPCPAGLSAQVKRAGLGGDGQIITRPMVQKEDVA